MNLLKKVHNCKLPGESMSESWAPVDSWFISLFTHGAGFLPSTVFIHVYSISKSSVHSLCTFCCKRCWPWSAQMQSVLPELQGTPAFITKKNMMKRWNDNVKSWVLKRFLNTTQVNKLPQEILHAILGIYLCQRAINLCPHKKNSKHWKCRNALEKQKVPTKLTLQRLASEFSTTTRRAKMLSKCSSGLWRIKTSGFITSVPKETAIGNHSRKS